MSTSGTLQVTSYERRRRSRRLAGYTARRVREEPPFEFLAKRRRELAEAEARNRGLGKWLDEMDRIHGPVSPEIEEWARRIMEGVDE